MFSFTRWGSLSEVQHLSYGYFSGHEFLSTEDRASLGLGSRSQLSPVLEIEVPVSQMLRGVGSGACSELCSSLFM